MNNHIKPARQRPRTYFWRPHCVWHWKKLGLRKWSQSVQVVSKLCTRNTNCPNLTHARQKESCIHVGHLFVQTKINVQKACLVGTRWQCYFPLRFFASLRRESCETKNAGKNLRAPLFKAQSGVVAVLHWWHPFSAGSRITNKPQFLWYYPHM